MTTPKNQRNAVLYCFLMLMLSFVMSVNFVLAKVVTIIADPVSGVAPLNVTIDCFVDVTTSTPEGYTIDFGDGSDKETFESSLYTHTFTHTYNAGFFKPIVKVEKLAIGGFTESDPEKIIVAKWQFETGDDVDSSPALGSDGIVYVGSDDGNLYAIYPETGEEKWRFSTGGKIQSSPAIGPDGMIYFGSNDQHLYAVDAEGKGKWAFDLGDNVFSSPAVSGDGSTIYVGASDHMVYSLTSQGTLRWTFATEGKIISSPSLGFDGIESTVYVGSLDNHVYALSANKGRLKWKFKANAEIYASPAIDQFGHIYVGECRNGDAEDYNFSFYSLNVDGSKFWEISGGGTGFYSSPAIGPDGIIYIGNWDGYLVALYPDGSKYFSLSTDPLADINSSPAVGDNGVVYVGCKNGNFYAFQNDDVSPIDSEDWMFQTGDDILNSSPVIDADGTIYFGSWDNCVYAINPGNLSLAESSWPMFRRNAHHDGALEQVAISSVISSFPTKNAVNVEVNTTQLKVNFSPEISESQIDIGNFKLYETLGPEIEGRAYVVSLKYNNTEYKNYSAVFESIDNELPLLKYGTSYMAYIYITENDPDAILDEDQAAGGKDSDATIFIYQWFFLTEQEPAEDEPNPNPKADFSDHNCFIESILNIK